MRVFFDTEFHERGSKSAIELISIGMVREDGEEYYAINRGVMWHSAFDNEWLRDNVLTQLPGRIVDYHNGGGSFEPDMTTGLFRPRSQIATEIAKFCDVPGVELWGYYSDYDHVVLAQLFGRMIDLPKHMPMYTRDFKQTTDMLMPGHRWPPQEDDEHNALADARWLRDQFKSMEHALVGSRVGELITL